MLSDVEDDIEVFYRYKKGKPRQVYFSSNIFGVVDNLKVSYDHRYVLATIPKNDKRNIMVIYDIKKKEQVVWWLFLVLMVREGYRMLRIWSGLW